MSLTKLDGFPPVLDFSIEINKDFTVNSLLHDYDSINQSPLKTTQSLSDLKNIQVQGRGRGGTKRGPSDP